ncbi:MAG: MipA/OmpV family protein [Sphingomicrobium sp.]
MIRYIPALLLACSTSALAQTAPETPLPPADEVLNANVTTIGGGIGMTPDYEGSNDYRIIPAAAIRTRIGNVGITTRGLYVYADLINTGGKVDFDLGPIAGLRMNRSGKIKDDVVDLLPERNKAIEVGGFAGVSFHQLTNPYDTLSIRLDAVHDVGKAHKSTVVTPTIDFATPLSRSIYVGASLSADFVSNRFADYYFSISPADTLASGLPTFDAGGGMKSWKVGALANYSLSGNLLKGWSIFALANHSQLLGDFKRSPIVRDRGSASQWMGALGLAYTF